MNWGTRNDIERADNVRKISKVQMVLTLLYCVCMVVSNILAAKQYVFIGGTALNCGTIVFPITYVLSDIFSEVYGYKWSRFSWMLATCACLFAVLCSQVAIAMPYPEFWTNQDAFAVILGNAPRTLFASMLAFAAGDLVNDRVFRRMREKNGNTIKGFGTRAIMSSFVGETVDSIVFFPLAFYGIVPVETMVITAIALIFMKVGYECVIYPATRAIVKKIIAYENAGGVMSA